MENAAFSLNGVSFTYPTGTAPALDSIDFTFEAGSFTVICGASGSGKSTLLRMLKPALTPHGGATGEILFFGRDIRTLSERDAAAKIGYVLQSPEDQVVCDKVWHELAFGLESLGCDGAYIRRRVAEMAAFFGIESLFYRDVSELSGGQKQLISLASVMVTEPQVLLLDEPTSRLDPIAAAELLSATAKINRELGTTVIMTEHRLEEALPLATSMAVMERGRIIASGAVADVAAELCASQCEMFEAMPAAARVWAGLGAGGACPLSVADGSAMLGRYAKSHPTKEVRRSLPREFGEAAISAEGVFFRYEEESPDVLRGFDFTLRRGEISAILGGNGAGKTTALRVLAGIRRPMRGTVTAAARISYLPQEPQALFVKRTVREELLFTLAGAGVAAAERDDRLWDIARLCGITELLDAHPFDLSGGELQRAALAKVLLTSPEALLLDEPTKGLDAPFKRGLISLLRSLAAAGVAILIVSHDAEFCAEIADTCSLFFDGAIASSGSAEEFFCKNSFYTTAAARMARRVVPDAVTVGDVLTAFGKTSASADSDEVRAAELPKAAVQAEKPRGTLPLWRRTLAAISAVFALGIFIYVSGVTDLTKLITSGGVSGAAAGQMRLTAAIIALLTLSVVLLGRRNPSGTGGSAVGARRIGRRTAVAAAMILAAIPVTLFFGIYYLGDRYYGAISIAVLIECTLPFFLVFEGRRPMARELVVIAVLCAIGIAGRAVFFMLPQFKPVMAIVIVAGVAFGGEVGFMVGAVTMLVSNILTGQGPWTPWQMFAMGIIGFFAGVLFRLGILRRGRGSLAAFGALSAILIYGGIMNPASVLIWSPASISWGSVIAAYVSGLPMDLIHAAATVFFLLAAADPMLDKLDRIKLKYGLME